MAAARLAASVTFEPMQVNCGKLGLLLEEVTGQVLMVPNEQEIHRWAIGNIAKVAERTELRMMLANPMPFALMMHRNWF